MIIKANVEMGIQSLFAAKQRSILALLGIVIGIGAVIALVSIGIITKEQSLRQFKELGTDFVVISKGWGGSFGENAPKLTLKQAHDIVGRVPGLNRATPMGTTGGNMSFRGQNLSGSIVATESDFLDINRLRLAEGRYISALDVEMPYCVLGSKFAKDLRDKGAKKVVGSEIKVKDRIFTVIGVLHESYRGGMAPFSADSSMFIPFSTYDRIFDDAEVSNVLARMDEGTDSKELTLDVKNYFALRDPELSVEVQTAEALIQQMKSQAQMFTVLLAGVGGIALLVGGIGVMNVMLVSVSERKKEIGIRRALGALQRDIEFQFIVEALVLCTLGGIIGVICGLGAAYAYAQYSKFVFVLSTDAVLIGVGVSTIVGLFFGYYPARQASKLDPIVALRSS